MNESRTQNPREEDQPCEVICPFCLLTQALSKAKKKHSAFFDHLLNAHIELLQAFKSVVDEQISSLEKKRESGKVSKKATKIKVE